MAWVIALPVFVSNWVYSPKPLQFGTVEFTPQWDEVVQTREIIQGFISLPEGAHIRAVVDRTSKYILDIIAKLGARIEISPK